MAQSTAIPSTSVGSAAVTLTASPNSTVDPPTAVVAIAGAPVSVTQPGGAPTCAYTVTPTSTSVPAANSFVLVNVTTDAGCEWSVSSGVPWLTAVPASSVGSGRVTVTASPNATANQRTGAVTIAGTSVTVTQPGGGPTNCSNDTDCDHMFDFWEIEFGLDPASAEGEDGAGGDPDNDGWTNGTEFVAQTHPRGFHTRYFAEGATGAFFDTRIALVNPGPTIASVLLRFRTSASAGVIRFITVPANSRATVLPDETEWLSDAEFSVMIESDVPVVADRTMTWNATGYGSHAETSLPAASTWHLAEGATHSGFHLFYLIHNPNETATTLQATYLLPTPTAPIVKSYEVPGNSRFTIWVNQEGAPLASTDVSAVITAPAERPIVVERAMYRDAAGQVFGAGHSSGGITAPSTTWFLAEGATGSYFDMFVLIANPNASDATVTATYLLPSGQTVVKTYNVGARSRFNIWVDLEDAALANTAVSTKLVASVPVVVERSMWWPNGSDNWHEAHDSPGATVTGTRWVLAEGEVGGANATETYVLIANTSVTAGSALVTLLFEDGTTASGTFPLAASSRFNVDVRSAFPQAVDKRFGVVVESVGNTPAQIVVERAMYSNANGVVWAAGTNALATRLQ